MSKIFLKMRLFLYNECIKEVKFMYQVVKMYGDMEPWWFLDGWKDDIVQVHEFEHYYEALKCYKKEWLNLHGAHSSFNSRSSIMTAFWDIEDQRWCEECDEYVQQYYSLALLTDWQEIPEEMYRPGYDRRSDKPNHRACSIKKNKPQV